MPKIMTLFIAFFAMIFTIDAGAKERSSYLCWNQYPALTNLNDADAVFSGVVRDVNALSASKVKVNFNVRKVWKGVKAEDGVVSVYSDKQYRYDFKNNKEYLVYAYKLHPKKHPERLTIIGCPRVQEVSLVAKNIADLPKPIFVSESTINIKVEQELVIDQQVVDAINSKNDDKKVSSKLQKSVLGKPKKTPELKEIKVNVVQKSISQPSFNNDIPPLLQKPEEPEKPEKSTVTAKPAPQDTSIVTPKIARTKKPDNILLLQNLGKALDQDSVNQEAQNCTQLPQKLVECQKFSCTSSHPNQPDAIVIHKINGFYNGGNADNKRCDYLQIINSKPAMQCRYSKASRYALARVIDKFNQTGTIKLNTKSATFSKEVEDQETLRNATKNGECKYFN